MTQMVKNLPTVQETRVQSLGQEDHLEQRMATHSSKYALHPGAKQGETIESSFSILFALG